MAGPTAAQQAKFVSSNEEIRVDLARDLVLVSHHAGSLKPHVGPGLILGARNWRFAGTLPAPRISMFRIPRVAC